jgi:hypothetical protein
VDFLVLELQHSRIGTLEIEERTRDYQSCGKTVVWLLDGTLGVQIAAQTERAHLLEFSRDLQTIVTFRQTGFVVLLDAGADQIYLVPLAELRGGCAWVLPPRPAAEIVALVGDPDRRGELLRFDAPPAACSLRVFQDPPGSGKTFRLIQRCVLALGDDGEAYGHYRFVFVLTKPHSAKNVVHQELVRQLPYAEASGEVQVLEKSDNGKVFHYLLKRRGSADPVDVFFATVDSFVYHMAPASKPRRSLEMFRNLTMAIEACGPALDRNSMGRFGGRSVTVNARSLICWDEATKLERHYLHALAKIMVTCGTDGVLAGDVMQSIENAKNCLRIATSADEAALIRELLPCCEVQVHRGDEVRRFGSKLAQALNDVVRFEKYHALIPRAATDIWRESEGEFEVHGVPVTFRGCDASLYASTVDILWEQLQRDVGELGLLPHELLLVSPLVKSNPVMDEFRDRLDEFWKERMERPDVRQAALQRAAGQNFYGVYDDPRRRPRWLAYLHRSEEGRPVDTTLSEWASRGVSIHSSQGDGRRLVYVVGLSEGALKCFTRGRTDVLEYESLWTVLMSRAKRRLRVFVERNFDDAWQRLRPYMSEATEAEVAPRFEFSAHPDLQRADLENAYGAVDDEAAQKFREDAAQAVEAAQHVGPAVDDDADLRPAPGVVEDLHHDVRMAIYHFAFLSRILRDERTARRKQTYAILCQASQLEVRGCADARKYHQVLRGEKGKDGHPKLAFIPVFNDARMPEAFAAFLSYASKAQEAMKLLLTNQEALVDLDDRGFLVFYHIVDISMNFQYAQAKFDMVYDALDRPRSTHDENLSSHYADILRSARTIADLVVSEGRLAGDSREWKLNHGLRLRTSAGSTSISPRLRVTFLGFSDSSAAVVLLTPKLDATNLSKVAGLALIVALLLENPADKDVERVQGCAGHWLCIAPLEECSPIWIDAREALRRNRGAAVEWLVGFLADSCKQALPKTVDFYAWHAKNGAPPEEILQHAEALMEHRGDFSGSFVHSAFERMRDNADDSLPCDVSAFSTALEKKMIQKMSDVRKWLTMRGSDRRQTELRS